MVVPDHLPHSADACEQLVRRLTADLMNAGKANVGPTCPTNLHQRWEGPSVLVQS